VVEAKDRPYEMAWKDAVQHRLEVLLPNSLIKQVLVLRILLYLEILICSGYRLALCRNFFSP
jgi:hypothetical protein